MTAPKMSNDELRLAILELIEIMEAMMLDYGGKISVGVRLYDLRKAIRETEKNR